MQLESIGKKVKFVQLFEFSTISKFKNNSFRKNYSRKNGTYKQKCWSDYFPWDQICLIKLILKELCLFFELLKIV